MKDSGGEKVGRGSWRQRKKRPNNIMEEFTKEKKTGKEGYQIRVVTKVYVEIFTVYYSKNFIF